MVVNQIKDHESIVGGIAIGIVVVMVSQSRIPFTLSKNECTLTCLWLWIFLECQANFNRLSYPNEDIQKIFEILYNF